MKRNDSNWFSDLSRALVIVAACLIPSAASAQWRATAGAQSHDKGTQAMAFLPNELWVHVDDDIQWSFATDEIHTVTFLKDSQIRPAFPVGCAPGGVQPSGSNYDASACVNSGPLLVGATYSVRFPVKGNFKLVCLVHSEMTGVVHVLAQSEALPYFQGYYDDQAAEDARDLLTDVDHQQGEAARAAHASAFANVVVAGVGEVVATGGGRQFRVVMRFLGGPVRIHVGDTVEWVNWDPIAPHTVTFGTEPPTAGTLVNVTTDPDGARHGTINSASDNVSSGLLVGAPQDRVGLAQSPAGVTRVRVTFTHEGTYDYICAVHDELGMKGRVVVVR
jgi:plastocyanin